MHYSFCDDVRWDNAHTVGRGELNEVGIVTHHWGTTSGLLENKHFDTVTVDLTTDTAI
jgi:hypothetical protein